MFDGQAGDGSAAGNGKERGTMTHGDQYLAAERIARLLAEADQERLASVGRRARAGWIGSARFALWSRLSGAARGRRSARSRQGTAGDGAGAGVASMPAAVHRA